MRLTALLLAALAGAPPLLAQQPAPTDPRIYEIVAAPSAARIEADVRTLAGFGTRNTMSDTLSPTRGIGAARRWVKAEFERISAECGGCLQVSYVASQDTIRPGLVANVVSVIAVQRGTTHPDRYVMMSGDLDSRASNTLDSLSDAPGANDNASGMAGTIEAARVLSKHRFGASIVYAALAGEEQGLFGGRALARQAKAEGWDVGAVLNNDMIGNIAGVDGIIDNHTFRVFSEPYPATATERERAGYRVYGGEVDGPSRQLARYVARMVDSYMPTTDAMMIYRLDRFGRGGHHRPFNDLGFPAVRIMETHEHYDRQHQDLRTENGRVYGDVVSGVNFPYAARLTAVNAAVLAGLAWAPPPPATVQIGGAVSASTTLAWDAVSSPSLAGYRIYWRDTTAPQWQHSRWVGKDTTRFTLENVVIDNFLFGVAAVAADGNESIVVFPSSVMRR
ncbi:MAG TPA: M28 family metallopeptidase [Gemmatimonadaceae bacterium]|nr:M28 family metallopeptidase [Gemmatimonadaceae bacterium]